MRDIVKSFKAYPARSLASAVVWGVVEFVALQRSLATGRSKPQV